MAVLHETVATLEDELIAFRRDLHAHPELAGNEVRTTSVVAARLSSAGIRVRRLAGSGLVADIGPTDPAYRVALIFQPAEETVPGGAHGVIAQGGLDGVTVTLSGRGGHTARPHLTQDLTYALAKVVTDVPAVLSRRVDPRAGLVMVWGSIHAGSAQNVIPSTGVVDGTLRA